MSRTSATFVAASLFALMSIAGTADAQSARVRIRRGAVTGLEMSLEGGLTAPRGGTLRWLVTAYEVLGLSDLRLATDAAVHVATSIARTDDAAEVRTDAFGRASVALAIPDDAPDTFTAVLRIVSHDGVQRRFDLPVRVSPGLRLEVHAARPQVRPGGPMRVFGRLADERSGRPREGRVILTLRDEQGRPLDAPATLSVDEAGLFAHRFTIPDDARGRVAIEARTDDDEHPVRVFAQSSIGEPTGGALLVAVGPGSSLVAPGARVPVTVVVRTPEGRPVPGTTVTLAGAERRDADRRAITDRRGRAQLAWTAPRYASGINDVAIQVTASREGWGTASGTAVVRVAADAHAASLAVEGGALAPSLGGHVWVRVVGPDGRPAPAGVAVHADGPRLAQGGVSATTDADGVATLDVTLGRGADATADRCGGETATAFDLSVGAAPSLTTRAVCLPLDPDAMARVRVDHPMLVAGAPLALTVDRVATAARLPVELTVFADGVGGPSAVAATVLQPSDRNAQIVLPADAVGPLWIRARPLFGDTRLVVRGGVAAAWVLPGAPGTAEAELSPEGSVGVRFGGRANGARSAVVLAGPIDETRPLADLLRSAALGPLGELRRDPGAVGDPLVLAALAAHTPPDLGAPAVLRNGRAVPVPAPADPTAIGLLRDPWRSRARFVTGRLALIFRALEGYVGESLPERMDDVAIATPRGFDFNAQILESVAASGRLGPSGATGLGGDPLTIEQLRAFDPALTYDNVARRITRERLFRLILALRQFVQSNGFDLPWSRLGDPSEWMRQLENQYVAAVGPVSRSMLVDGWGRPFQLRRASGGRSRFRFVDPLGDWEIVSAGPDGRPATGDDIWDPTGRVLRSGTPYADAVGEDLLVARLEGVELGRATVQLLAGVEPQANAGRVPPQSSEPSRRLAAELWGGIPSVFEPETDPLALRRPTHPGDGAGGDVSRMAATGGEITVRLDEEPRTWGAVVWAWTDEGWGSVAEASTLAGAPIIVEADAPSRLRAGEPVELDLTITNVRNAVLPLRLATEGDGLEVRGPDELTLGAEEAETITVRLAPGSAPMGGEARVRFVGGHDEPVRSLAWPLAIVSGDHPLRVRAAGLVRGRPWRTHFEIPGDARRAQGRVVVLTPSALAADPDLADLRRDDPALVAFSNALAGRRSSPALWSALLRAQGPDGFVEGRDRLVSTACASVAWASAAEHDVDARAALARLRLSLASLGDPTGSDPDPSGVRTAAAVLGALAAGGVPELSDASARALDPVARLAAALRLALRRTLRNHPEEPSLLARASAGLLLADPRDAYGLAMLERAAEHLAETPDGGSRVVPSERMTGRTESLSATLALAVAAHQANRPELAERLLRGALGRDHVALRAGGETALWLVASGAYGSLGGDAPRVVVTIDGTRHELSLEEGRAVVELGARPGRHDVQVEASEGAAFVRVEAALDRPFQARSDGPLGLSLDGDVGDLATGAALELTVQATEPVDDAVVDISLPAGVEADEAFRAALASAGVLRVEAREPGFVRVWLGPMAAGTARTLALPLHWTVLGSLRGLAAIAYPLGSPESMTVLAPRAFEVERTAHDEN